MAGIAPTLSWLPLDSGWRDKLKDLRRLDRGAMATWEQAVALAGLRLDFVAVNALDQAVQTLFADGPPPGLVTKPVRLAILGSSTTTHLHANIRVAALRRGIWLSLYETDYGQYFQELLDNSSGLHAFQPDVVLFVIDAFSLASGVTAGMADAAAAAALDETTGRIAECWRIAREAFSCQIIQQAALDVFPAIIGENEARLGGSRATFVAAFNAWLRQASVAARVDVLSLDHRAARDGLFGWFNPALWHRSKQEVVPTAAPFYGDLVGRLVAAKQGRSFKCLVLDLDNTLWGGVIGDDGLDGIVLGQGSANGEAFVAVQEYAREQSRRGVILAVCSKNDEASAREPFERHPDMVLKSRDIACFVANWQDKAANIREIAAQLNIGLDALVFLDDNPFERALIREELPMVAVPEVGDDPALYPYTLADAGYFESLALTDEDRERSTHYQGNLQREALKHNATDMESYLRGLDMKLIWRRFDQLGLQRTVQLINKTNQFNLTTQRYTEDDIRAVMGDPRAIGLQLRLTDRFGDNGVIGIVIGKLDAHATMILDTWLMSCRVLGRQVEQATLNLIAELSREMGALTLEGHYKPTKKNGMVKDHYRRLGFEVVQQNEDECSRSVLKLDGFADHDTFIEIIEG